MKIKSTVIQKNLVLLGLENSTQILQIFQFFFVMSQEFIPGNLYCFYQFYFHFCKQEMRNCSDDSPRTGQRNVQLNKNTSENVAFNKTIFSVN